MKNYLAPALLGLLYALAGHHAHAAPLAYANNQANGMIVLTDEQNNCPMAALYAYRTDAGGTRALGGCYIVTPADPFVHLTWSTDTRAREYPIDAFTLTAAGQARAAARQHEREQAASN